MFLDLAPTSQLRSNLTDVARIRFTFNSSHTIALTLH